ncbi:DUF3786 domain-containing protein [Candidatus Omnitrophota bacterium]
MGYEAAISKSWQELEDAAEYRALQLKFLADEYSIDLDSKKVLSLSCNVAAKDYVSILVLHYATKRIEGLPLASGEWIDFRQLDGGQGYYPNFKERVIGTIKRKYGPNPQALLKSTERFNAQRVELADVSISLEAFEGVPILIQLWKGDEEFGPEANVLFDKNIKDIFCTEDIVVLSEFIAHKI